MKTINEYFSQSEKVSFISEYLLSKTKKPIDEPQCTWTIEQIVDWLKNNGVTKCVRFNGTFQVTEENTLMIELGPEDHKNIPSHYWVGLIGNPRGDATQTLTIKPKSKSIFKDIDDEETFIDFEKAIEIAYKMIENPNKVIKL